MRIASVVLIPRPSTINSVSRFKLGSIPAFTTVSLVSIIGKCDPSRPQARVILSFEGRGSPGIFFRVCESRTGLLDGGEIFRHVDAGLVEFEEFDLLGLFPGAEDGVFEVFFEVAEVSVGEP